MYDPRLAMKASLCLSYHSNDREREMLHTPLRSSLQLCLTIGAQIYACSVSAGQGHVTIATGPTAEESHCRCLPFSRLPDIPPQVLCHLKALFHQLPTEDREWIRTEHELITCSWVLIQQWGAVCPCSASVVQWCLECCCLSLKNHL